MSTFKPRVPIRKSDQRSLEQIKEHYEIEKKLFSQLRNSTQGERKELYTKLYDELFEKVRDHPLLTRRSDSEATNWIVDQRMQLLGRFLTPETIYLEVGPGDCSVALDVAKRVKKVYAADVSTEITKRPDLPNNFELIISDGCSIPAPENTVNVAYSHQLMEHLHPEDALDQLQNICKALAPGGIYICITPNRLSGPHDISQYFDEVATGVHLKEYTVTELDKLFIQAGFSSVKWVKSKKNMHIEIPLVRGVVLLVGLAEDTLAKLPYETRRSIASTPLLFRGMTIIGKK
ncbi:MAG: class I SAM-dependent methyltransferase [Cyanobacteria bacterium J06592_8]